MDVFFAGILLCLTLGLVLAATALYRMAAIQHRQVEHFGVLGPDGPALGDRTHLSDGSYLFITATCPSTPEVLDALDRLDSSRLVLVFSGSVGGSESGMFRRLEDSSGFELVTGSSAVKLREDLLIESSPLLIVVSGGLTREKHYLRGGAELIERLRVEDFGQSRT